MGKNPHDMAPDEYDAWIRQQPSMQRQIMCALRESRYVAGFFPPYSSGAGDYIHDMIRALKDEWHVPYDPDKDEWDA